MFSLLVIFYFLNLVFFSFTFNPIMCSVILMANSALVGGVMYSVLGLSWYPLLLTMVYLGGVYIIILFVSSHVQNDQAPPKNAGLVFIGLLGLGIFAIWGLDYNSFSSIILGSEGLVNFGGLGLYLTFSFILLFMFYLITVISCGKEGFLR